MWFGVGAARDAEGPATVPGPVPYVFPGLKLAVRVESYVSSDSSAGPGSLAALGPEMVGGNSYSGLPLSGAEVKSCPSVSGEVASAPVEASGCTESSPPDSEVIALAWPGMSFDFGEALVFVYSFADWSGSNLDGMLFVFVSGAVSSEIGLSRIGFEVLGPVGFVVSEETPMTPLKSCDWDYVFVVVCFPVIGGTGCKSVACYV